ncbi:MAG: ABC transporter transmembrane domain-containing protein [Polyangiaceae bacterium]
MKLAYLRGSFGLVLQATIAVGILVVFWYGGHLVISKELDPGGFLAFHRALSRLTWPLISLGFVVSLVQRGRASYSRLEDVFKSEPDVTDGPLPAPAQIDGRLEVKHLSFAYGERTVVNDVSFALEPGASLAIVGRTGSGKSTLALLLARLLPTPRGSVWLDGKDVCDLPLSSVRGAVGYAQQSAFLFSTTAGRNIGFALDDPDSPESLERIRQAADDARILEEVMSLPDGFDTVVGERGVQLSGGQKQRIALAAAFVSKPQHLGARRPAQRRRRAYRARHPRRHRAAERHALGGAHHAPRGRCAPVRSHHGARRGQGGRVRHARRALSQRRALRIVRRRATHRERARAAGSRRRSQRGGVAVSARVSKPNEAKQRTEKILQAFHEEERFGRAYDWELMKRLWPFFKPQRALLLVALCVVLITAVSSLIRPLIMQRVIDRGVMFGDASALTWGGITLASIIVVEQVLNFIQLYTTQVAGARAMTDLRRHVFVFLHRLRLGFFDNQLVGRLVSRVTNDVDAILDLFGSGALLALGDLVKLVGIVALMLALDWKLALVAFAATPPVMLLIVLLRRRMREAFRDIRAKTARMNATMNEQVSGMTVIQAYSRQESAAREFDSSNVGYREANLRSILWDALQDAAIDTVSAICLASIVVSLGYRPVSFGTVVAFSVYIVQFFEPITLLAQRYTLLQSAMAGAERVFKLLDTEAPDCPTRSGSAAGDRELSVAFEDVSFSYKPGVPVLRARQLRRAARREGGAGRPHGQRQDHRHGAALAPLRGQLRHHSRRR